MRFEMPSLRFGTVWRCQFNDTRPHPNADVPHIGLAFDQVNVLRNTLTQPQKPGSTEADLQDAFTGVDPQYRPQNCAVIDNYVPWTGQRLVPEWGLHDTLVITGPGLKLLKDSQAAKGRSRADHAAAAISAQQQAGLMQQQTQLRISSTGVNGTTELPDLITSNTQITALQVIP